MTQQERFCASYLARRQRARTDLYWLANEVLSPPDSKILVPETHSILTEHCQKFAGYKELMDPKGLRVAASEPLTPMYELEGKRDRLLLASRGHLKTTIQVIAHSIQWIINYPNVRILICTSTDEKAQLVVGKIKAHFQFNRKFRFLFPEFCPPDKKVSDWGSRTEIVVSNRTRQAEPTIMTASVGKALASTHHDVIKCTDVVTENNVRTPGQLQEIMDFFGYLEPLRERGESFDGTPNPGWLDIEGTIYDFSDYHATMVDYIRENPECGVQLTQQSCWIDEEKTKPWWPQRFPAAELHRIRRSPAVGPILFASQYELQPVPPGTGLATQSEIHFFDQSRVKELLPRYTTVQTTVDLAGMDPKSHTSDFTVFNTAGFTRDARVDVLSILRGRYTLDQIVDAFFLVQKVFPKNVKFKVQRDHFARVLEPLMTREMAKRGVYLWIEYTQISTSVSKVQRIQGLQGWFKMGLIRFSDGITCSSELIDEVLRFPKGKHDDILDTLADQFEDAKGHAIGAVIPQERQIDYENGPLMSFDPYHVDREPDMSRYYSDVTGV